MLVALLLATLLGGGSGSLPFIDKALAKQIQGVVADQDRRDRVVAEVKAIEEITQAHDKKLAALIGEVKKSGATEIDAAILERATADRRAAQEAVIEALMRMRTSMTREEWTAAFAPAR